jgi:hypothetical protein
MEESPVIGAGLKASAPQPETIWALGGFPTTIFAGKASVIEKLVRLVSGGALIVRVIKELLPALTGLVPNALVSVTPAPVAYIVTVAVRAVRLLGPWVVVRFPIGIVLVYGPPTSVPVTGTVTVQVPGLVNVGDTPTGIVPPVRVISCVPAMAVMVPPAQVVLGAAAGG